MGRGRKWYPKHDYRCHECKRVLRRTEFNSSKPCPSCGCRHLSRCDDPTIVARLGPGTLEAGGQVYKTHGATIRAVRSTPASRYILLRRDPPDQGREVLFVDESRPFILLSQATSALRARRAARDKVGSNRKYAIALLQLPADEEFA